MPWRTEPEIAPQRQAFLAERKGITPDVERGIFPFKGLESKLTRADIEWLLATHESRGVVGPVVWDAEKQKPESERRIGLDLRGADLEALGLSSLPLACLQAGASFAHWTDADPEYLQAAVINLKGAHLGGAQLQGAILREAQMEGAILIEAQLEGANLIEAQLKTANLNSAHLESADLTKAQLEGANLINARLQGADLTIAHLEGAELKWAHLEGATLDRAHLKAADLSEARLEGVDLGGAQLEGAILTKSHLLGADLARASLTGANLTEARLEGADLTAANVSAASLQRATFDKLTRLNDAVFTAVSLDQATFDNTNLSVVDWTRVPVLGDERLAQARISPSGRRKPRLQRRYEYGAAARAYRRLAAALQANGLSDDASHYLYRAQIMQRRLRWHQRQVGAYLFSVLLAVLAGYGYRLGRIAVAYLVAVGLFAIAFFTSGILAGGALDVQQGLDAVQISLNAIHGRVFFAQFHLDTLQSWLATIESVIGIVIEGVFVAMLIQRFFGK
jgi:uncharacterized protein YjbI with pentapeptide repeats